MNVTSPKTYQLHRALACSEKPEGTRGGYSRNTWGPDTSSKSSAAKKMADDTSGHKHQLQQPGPEVTVAAIILMLLQDSVLCVKA